MEGRRAEPYTPSAYKTQDETGASKENIFMTTFNMSGYDDESFPTTAHLLNLKSNDELIKVFAFQEIVELKVKNAQKGLYFKSIGDAIDEHMQKAVGDEYKMVHSQTSLQALHLVVFAKSDHAVIAEKQAHWSGGLLSDPFKGAIAVHLRFNKVSAMIVNVRNQQTKLAVIRTVSENAGLFSRVS